MEKLSRRDFLRASAIATAGAVVVACAKQPTEAPTKAAATTAPTQAAAPTSTTIPTRAPTATPVPTPVEVKEAPAVAQMVADGKLPPLSERLPQNPLVIQMDWQKPGKYGGRQRTYHTWLGCQEESMYGYSTIRYVDDGLGIESGLAEKWEHNDDKSEWTLYFRRGLKWSDGEPWTVDDIMFWWEDMVLNEDHPRGPPDEARSGVGTLCEFVKVDEYTLKMVFDAPAPLTADRLAMWVNGNIGPAEWAMPRHYLEQFHPKYNKDYADYVTFEQNKLFRQNPDSTTTTSWMCSDAEIDVYQTWDRNPYYYCVDPDGNQLPYLDGIDETRAQDNEAGKAAILAGQADFEWHQPFQLSDVATLKGNEGSSGLETRFIDTGSGTGSMFFFSQDYREDKYRELFRTPEFQRALSHAWNRAEVQKILYFNTGELTTGTLSPKAIEYQFNDEAKERYAEWRDLAVEYDPEKAKEMLDAIDIVDTTGDGWRNFPDGSEILIRFDAPGDAGTEHATKNELLAKNWGEIGLQTMMNPIPSGASEMWRAGEKMSNCAWEVGDGPNHLVFPQWLVPIGDERWAPMQGRMYSVRGTEKEGTETDVDPWERQPPRLDPEAGGPVEQLWKIYDATKIEPDTLTRHAMVWDMMKIHVNYGPFFLGCVANMPRLLHVSKDMRNVPTRDDLVTGGFGNPWILPHPAVWNPEIFYYEHPEDH